MSYQVLARKWRPQQFGDMIGQEHVLKALVNALDTDRLHHAYLFTGMRGVGKTTIARIFAKCLNCERVDGVTATPCGECSTCQDIEAGRFFDLIEVDAASRTKVDETRELLENVPYAPTSGRYKVYLIDEVHMFSNHSFNALLKTLEEPPAHVKFLLATTDPQKVPVTVLSRCLQFNLKRMVPARLADYLEKILNEESIGFERGALDLIARAADGSVRDSLSLVEQAAAYGEGSVRVSEVESMLGRVSVARLLDVLSALADSAVQPLFDKINELAEYAPDYHELLGELLSLTHRIALLQSVPGSVEPDATELDQLQALAERVSAEDLQLWYQIGMHARRDMPYAPDPREAFDMAILRMLAFAPQGASSSQASLSGPSSVGSVAPSGGTATSSTASTQASTQAAPSAKGPATGPAASKSAQAPASTPTSATGSAASPASLASTSKPTSNATTAKPASTSAVLSADSGASGNQPDENTQAPPAAAVSTSAMDRKAQLDAALGRTPKKKVASDSGAAAAPAAGAPAAKAAVTAPPNPAAEAVAASVSTSPAHVSKPGPEPASESAAAASATSPAHVSKPELASESAPAASAASVPIAADTSSTAEDQAEQSHPVLPFNNDNWPTIVRRTSVSGLPMQLAMNSAVADWQEGVLTLRLANRAQHLNKPTVVQKLSVDLGDYCAEPVKVRVELTNDALVTPTSLMKQAERQAQKDAEASIDSDPLLAELVSRVDGEVTQNSVRPIPADATEIADNGENS